MDSTNFTVVLTGAAGNIGSILLFMLANENIFGENKRINLRLIDLPETASKLKGLALELEDCLFPFLQSVDVLPECSESFKDADCLILVAGKPRRLGMERRDLLEQNAQLFKRQAELCQGVLKPTTKVLVVANPCNTNALVFSKFLPELNPSNITALSWLDQNRAKNFLAKKLKTDPARVKNVAVFGNHSNTMFVDLSKAYIDSQFLSNDSVTPGSTEKDTRPSRLRQYLSDDFANNELQELIRKRGGEIIQAKGTSSAFSAAKAIVDHLKAWFSGSNGEIVSMAVIVDKIMDHDEPLCVSMPVICSEQSFKVIDNLLEGVDETSKAAMQESVEELSIEKLIAFEFFTDKPHKKSK
jgi:malate dehydrogenase